MSEEDIISLIVEGHCTATFELRIVMEQRSQHSGNSLTQSRLEIVKNDFRSMGCKLLDDSLLQRETYLC